MTSISHTGMERLKIEAFENPDGTGQKSDTFVAMLNPSSFTVNFEIAGTETPTDGGTQADQYKGLKLGEIAIELLIDDTGAIPKELATNPDGDVFGALATFKKVCFDVNSGLHHPNYLKITYGEIVYNCKLKSYGVNFTLFASNGKALRAKISAVFTETKSVEFQQKERKQNSPDVTHIREMKQYQTLVGLGYNIYKRNDLYQEIARVNDFNTFRRIETGTKVIFPPIAKQ